MKLRSRDFLKMLVALHKEDGRAQRAIATRAGLSTAMLSALMAGTKDRLTPEKAIALAGSLGVAPGVLFRLPSSVDGGRIAA